MAWMLRDVQRTMRPRGVAVCLGVTARVGYTWSSMMQQTSPQRILVVQPSWVGDAVMATPMLRALRELFPHAHISYLLRRYVKPIYEGMPWADRLITYRTGKTRAKAGRGTFDLAGRLRAGKFDLAILLPNSFE